MESEAVAVIQDRVWVIGKKVGKVCGTMMGENVGQKRRATSGRRAKSSGPPCSFPDHGTSHKAPEKNLTRLLSLTPCALIVWILVFACVKHASLAACALFCFHALFTERLFRCQFPRVWHNQRKDQDGPRKQAYGFFSHRYSGTTSTLCVRWFK